MPLNDAKDMSEDIDTESFIDMVVINLLVIELAQHGNWSEVAPGHLCKSSHHMHGLCLSDLWQQRHSVILKRCLPVIANSRYS